MSILVRSRINVPKLYRFSCAVGSSRLCGCGAGCINERVESLTVTAPLVSVSRALELKLVNPDHG